MSIVDKAKQLASEQGIDLGEDKTLPPPPGGGPAEGDLGAGGFRPGLEVDPQKAAAAQAQTGMEDFPTDENELLAQILGAAESEQDQFQLGWLFGLEGGLQDLDPSQQSRFNETLRKPFKASRGKITQFQRNLVAAGYLQPGDVDVPGWYGAETQRAYARLLFDAQVRGGDPSDVLTERISIKLKKDPKVLAANAEMSDDEHRQAMVSAYIEAWGQRPPPGYLETLKGLNPEELAALERQKEAWLGSDQAQAESNKMENDLAAAFQQQAGQQGGQNDLLKLLGLGG
jgi:hypothetical protein